MPTPGDQFDRPEDRSQDRSRLEHRLAGLDGCDSGPMPEVVHDRLRSRRRRVLAGRVGATGMLGVALVLALVLARPTPGPVEPSPMPEVAETDETPWTPGQVSLASLRQYVDEDAILDLIPVEPSVPTEPVLRLSDSGRVLQGL